MTLQKQVCSSCKGEGMLLNRNRELKPCHKCKGKGTVTVNKPDSYHDRTEKSSEEK